MLAILSINFAFFGVNGILIVFSIQCIAMVNVMSFCTAVWL